LLEATIPFDRHVLIPVMYKCRPIGGGFKADIIVDSQIIIALKSIESISPAHEAQPRTYLRMSEIRVGLLMNFNVPGLIDGLRRFVV
jgi:GxxExxY protein